MTKGQQKCAQLYEYNGGDKQPQVLPQARRNILFKRDGSDGPYGHQAG